LNYVFDWSVFLKGIGGKETYLTWLLSAWQWTLIVAFLGFIVAFVLGFTMGVFRTTGNKYLVFIGTAWTELFRNIPILVQLFLWYFVVPELFPITKALPSFMLVVMALGFFTSSRISEQVRAGIDSIPTGQRYAALALGLTSFQMYRYVLLPVACRIILPPLTSEAMNIIKNSSVAFAIGIAEMTMFAMQAQEETSRGIEIYLVVTGLYFLSAIVVNILSSFLERAIQIPNFVGAK
jgi:glutamate/aspartate transport system permease protein